MTSRGSICSVRLHHETPFHSFLPLFSFMHCSSCWSRKRYCFPKDICMECPRHNFPAQIFWFLSAYSLESCLFFIVFNCVQLWRPFVAIVSPLRCSSTSGTVVIASGLLKQSSLLIFARYQNLKKKKKNFLWGGGIYFQLVENWLLWPSEPSSHRSCFVV